VLVRHPVCESYDEYQKKFPKGYVVGCRLWYAWKNGCLNNSQLFWSNAR